VAAPAPRRAWFDGRCTASVYRRDLLPAGFRARGPAIVCEYSATTVVPPGWRVGVERTGGLVLERSR
jgi:N-methylhydantoinase A